MGWGPGYKGRARWTSAWKNTGMGVLKETLCCEPGTTMHGGEFAYWHPAWVCEVYEEVGPPMAEHIETKHDEVSGTSSKELWEKIKRKMEEVANEMDIAFTTDF